MYVSKLKNSQISEITKEIMNKREMAINYIVTAIEKKKDSIIVNITAFFKEGIRKIHIVMLDYCMMYRIDGIRMEPNEYYQGKMKEWFGNDYSSELQKQGLLL